MISAPSMQFYAQVGKRKEGVFVRNVVYRQLIECKDKPPTPLKVSPADIVSPASTSNAKRKCSDAVPSTPAKRSSIGSLHGVDTLCLSTPIRPSGNNSEQGGDIAFIDLSSDEDIEMDDDHDDIGACDEDNTPVHCPITYNHAFWVVQEFVRLANKGYSCYMASLVQSLLALPAELFDALTGALDSTTGAQRVLVRALCELKEADDTGTEVDIHRLRRALDRVDINSALLVYSPWNAASSR